MNPPGQSTLKRRLQRDPKFRTRYRQQAIDLIRGSRDDSDASLGLEMLENITLALRERNCLHFEPEELRIWTLATKHRQGHGVHDLIRAGMILILCQLAGEMVLAGKKVPREIETYLQSHPALGRNTNGTWYRK